MLKRICQSRKLAALKTDGARLLYTWLIPNVDINGCFSGDENVIKGQIFTRLRKSTKTINSYLVDLASVGLIVWYESDGDRFLKIPDFTDKQPSLRSDRESPSNIPQPQNGQKEYYKKANIPIELVRQVSKRDGKVCQICGKVGIEDAHFKHYVIEKTESGKEISFEIDHIIPEYLGGETKLDNLRLVCRKCNRQKGIKDAPAELQRNSGVAPPKVKESKVKIKESKDKYMSIFDQARKLFKGTKRGLKTEYDYFVKKHTDWKDVLPLLVLAVSQQIIWRAEDGRYWKNFKTWIFNRCWEETKGVSQKRGNVEQKKCNFSGCSEIGVYFAKDDTGQDYWRCEKHKSRWTPSLPKELTENVLKSVPGKGKRSLSDKQNEQKNKLGVR